MARPLSNGGNGDRDARGRFAPGNPGGPGNPYARKVARLRSVLLDAVTEDDLRAIAAALVQQARSGDVKAAHELFDRLVGRATDPPCEPDALARHEDRMKLTERNRLDAMLPGLCGRAR